ncbi:MAG TPA: pseudouridine synthase [Candidatus Saccharimonadia bacterium]
MRINRYVAAATGLSRRAADEVISQSRIHVNEHPAQLGMSVGPADSVRLDGTLLRVPQSQTIMLHKPVGYITSRRQQGQTPTIYRLLPPELRRLKPIGRLDRDSSGLLLLTDDGELAQQLQHPSKGKWKRYEVRLDRPLGPEDQRQLEQGVTLPDGPSLLKIQSQGSTHIVSLQEGRNRQIRRSFDALGYKVTSLHRTDFGSYRLGTLGEGEWKHESTA